MVYHYAGKVKYTIKDFREKNSDQIRMDIVNVLKSSSLTFVRELMGTFILEYCEIEFFI